MKTKAVLIAVGLAVAGLIGLGAIESNKQIQAAKAKSQRFAENCISVHNDDAIKGTTSACGSVETKYLSKEQLKQYNAAYAKHKEIEAKKAEEKKAANEKWRAEQKAKEAKRAEEKHQAEAKFKAEGWFEVSTGIYGRWCTQTCSNAEVIGDQSYWLMEVWAKDRAAGDIYAQINVLQGGTVIGWTNDTAYLSRGQKGVLTFAKYLPGGGGQYQAELVKFNARG